MDLFFFFACHLFRLLTQGQQKLVRSVMIFEPMGQREFLKREIHLCERSCLSVLLALDIIQEEPLPLQF